MSSRTKKSTKRVAAKKKTPTGTVRKTNRKNSATDSSRTKVTKTPKKATKKTKRKKVSSSEKTLKNSTPKRVTKKPSTGRKKTQKTGKIKDDHQEPAAQSPKLTRLSVAKKTPVLVSRKSVPTRTKKSATVKPASRSRFSLHSSSSSQQSETKTSSRTKKSAKLIGPRQLEKMTDDQLLDLKLCDLDLDISKTDLQPRVDRLYEELSERGIIFQPHVWLSDEWFSPDGIPGIAIPFYLAHPRLMRLERKMMLEVEGGTEEWCMRILRHEAGHTLDTAFRLNRKRQYREIFGKYSDPYPEYYRPKPKSRKFVVHLEPWYAQSHPAEDFAETFAVCLRPGSRWKTHYKKWPAIKKLEYVDQLLESLAEQKPKVRSRKKIDSIKSLKKTLRDHYQQRRAKYEIDMPTPFDRDLKKLFCMPEDAENSSSSIPISTARKSVGNTEETVENQFHMGSHRPSSKSILDKKTGMINSVDCMASALLRKHRTEIERQVTKWTGENRYTVNLVMREIIDRCRKLRLRAKGDETELLRNTAILVTVQTMHYLHSGLHRVAL